MSSIPRFANRLMSMCNAFSSVSLIKTKLRNRMHCYKKLWPGVSLNVVWDASVKGLAPQTTLNVELLEQEAI